MSSVQKLFEIAVSGSTRAERRNAFNQLRELSVRGDEPEASEAREALQDSAGYAQKIREEK